MVLYLLCFDLSEPPSKQQTQLQYWLSYLNSLLCAGHRILTTHAYSNWRVMLVGTKADIKQENSLEDGSYWENKFPIIPISSKIYHISAMHATQHAKQLQEEIKAKCKRILDTSTTNVPCSHRDLWDTLQSRPEFIITQDQIPTFHKRWENKALLEGALGYLHSIGEIVWFSKGRICLKPAIISQTLAKFVAPEAHKISGTVISTAGNKALLDLKLGNEG